MFVILDLIVVSCGLVGNVGKGGGEGDGYLFSLVWSAQRQLVVVMLAVYELLL